MHKLSNINKILVTAPKILSSTEAASLTVRMSRLTPPLLFLIVIPVAASLSPVPVHPAQCRGCGETEEEREGHEEEGRGLEVLRPERLPRDGGPGPGLPLPPATGRGAEGEPPDVGSHRRESHGRAE